MKILYSMIILVIIIQAACTRYYDYQVEQMLFNNSRIIAYNDGIVREIEMAGITEELFIKWIDNLSGKWQISYITYAPNMMICFEKGNVNLCDDITIMNYYGNTNCPIQLVRDPTILDRELLGILAK